MKKKLFTLALVAASYMNAFPQATSLTIDCQAPGWLSSYINPSDIPTLRDLTITGQINGTDLATIGNLVKNYSLQGRLDLGDVTIAENRLTGDMFGVTDCKLQYMALPKSIGKMENCIEWVKIDTLVCGCIEQPDFYLGAYSPSNKYTEYCSSIKTFEVNYLILREGIKSITVARYDDNIKNNNTERIHFPNSIKHFYKICGLQALSYMNVPEGVETFGPRLDTNIQITSDTLYIPSSVKTFWDTWAGVDYKKTTNENGRIRCLFLPDNLETFGVDALCLGAKVAIHIKATIPPTIKQGYFNSNTIVYVPLGYKEVYKTTGDHQWGGATILEEVYAEQIDISSPEILYVGDSNLNYS